jgi:hypothetical protein
MEASPLTSVQGAVLRTERGFPMNGSKNHTPDSFLLIQYHKEYLLQKSTHVVPKKRFTKLFMQMCGSFEASELAQSAADTLILNVKILFPHFDMQRLQWNVFVDFDTIPTQHSDHFVIYCRSAPILIAR